MPHQETAKQGEAEELESRLLSELTPARDQAEIWTRWVMTIPSSRWQLTLGAFIDAALVSRDPESLVNTFVSIAKDPRVWLKTREIAQRVAIADLTARRLELVYRVQRDGVIDEYDGENGIRALLAKILQASGIELSHPDLIIDEVNLPIEDRNRDWSIKGLGGPMEASLHVAGRLFGLAGKTIRNFREGVSSTPLADPQLSKQPKMNERFRFLLVLCGFHGAALEGMVTQLVRAYYGDWETHIRRNIFSIIDSHAVFDDDPIVSLIKMANGETLDDDDLKRLAEVRSAASSLSSIGQGADAFVSACHAVLAEHRIHGSPQGKLFTPGKSGPTKPNHKNRKARPKSRRS